MKAGIEPRPNCRSQDGRLTARPNRRCTVTAAAVTAVHSQPAPERHVSALRTSKHKTDAQSGLSQSAWIEAGVNDFGFQRSPPPPPPFPTFPQPQPLPPPHPFLYGLALKTDTFAPRRWRRYREGRGQINLTPRIEERREGESD